MSLVLDFEDGTFYGHRVRTTPDHFVSVYDVIRVLGVGRDPTQAWKVVKNRLQQNLEKSIEFDHHWKIHKFKGQGQRFTPVIDNHALVKLLFQLPGKKARQLLSESAETLVRIIGGDESLIAQIKQNQQTAINDPDSVQAFMAKQPEILKSPIDQELQLEERRFRLKQLQLENDKLAIENDKLATENKKAQMDMIEDYRQYCQLHIHDSRIKEKIQNDIINRTIDMKHFC